MAIMMLLVFDTETDKTLLADRRKYTCSYECDQFRPNKGTALPLTSAKTKRKSDQLLKWSDDLC